MRHQNHQACNPPDRVEMREVALSSGHRLGLAAQSGSRAEGLDRRHEALLRDYYVRSTRKILRFADGAPSTKVRPRTREWVAPKVRSTAIAVATRMAVSLWFEKTGSAVYL